MDTTLLLIILILAVSSFVQSVTGFGFALVAVASLPQIMELREAVALIAIYNLFVSTVTLLMNWQGLQWRRALPIMIAGIIAIPIGFIFLHSASKELLLRILGVLLIFLGVTDFILARYGHLSLPKWTAYPLGFVGGLLGGAFNVGGPPIVAYVYSQPWRKTEMVAVLQVAFLSMGLLRNALMGVSGEYTGGLLKIVALGIPAGFAAIWIGRKVLDRIPRERLRMGVFVFLVVMGVKYLLV